jgi:hypothetical protein
VEWAERGGPYANGKDRNSVHGLIASILAQMDVLDYMERHFLAEAHADFADTEAKRKKLLDACAKELWSKYPRVG